MPNISETSVSDISLSRACTVMIIFFLVDGKSIEGLDAAIQPCLNSQSIAHSSRQPCGPILRPTYMSDYRGASFAKDLSHKVATCGRDDRKSRLTTDLRKPGVTPNVEIARLVGVSRRTMNAWRARYAERGLAGLADEKRCGRRRSIDQRRIVAETLTPPPASLGVTH
jgi:Winged helix-turn helix